ncbi:dimethylsulfoniopropionate demethylase [Aliamphritea spongicola]|uniref:dimethylsulfoniopropionate demethylase n=1 Tax=Aliamphritea spongicola TaxID=707589 RepID=UPI00196B9AA6|nr:dimethylsulfoniopropionate demethylase [Aliamphritea spongicola]MBN3561158.1 dimethylsulfoniopropionate demethylase [Aliamphritea spongicola]
MMPALAVSRRTRSTPFTSRVEAMGVQAYTVYNHMLLPTAFQGIEEDYWHLCEHVQVWDVSCERQVEITGPDAQKLIQLMTPRDLSNARAGQCFYLPLCDEKGMLINDPIAIKHSDDHWWLSIADSDVKLWAKGIATGMQLDVKVCEPDVWPLAVQGPKAEELMARVFGEEVKDIRFFQYRHLNYRDTDMVVARSGWSKQGGFEIYVNDAELGCMLWDDLFSAGEDLQVAPGCPNLIERIESGLLSFGNDMDYSDTPLECGLDKYVSLSADINSLSIEALRNSTPRHQLVGLVCQGKHSFTATGVYMEELCVGEITSWAWSPKYGVTLAFARCNPAGMDEGVSLTVNSDSGAQPVVLSGLPFNFNDLGLTAHEAGQSESVTGKPV